MATSAARSCSGRRRRRARHTEPSVAPAPLSKKFSASRPQVCPSAAVQFRGCSLLRSAVQRRDVDAARSVTNLARTLLSTTKRTLNVARCPLGRTLQCRVRNRVGLSTPAQPIVRKKPIFDRGRGTHTCRCVYQRSSGEWIRCRSKVQPPPRGSRNLQVEIHASHRRRVADTSPDDLTRTTDDLQGRTATP